MGLLDQAKPFGEKAHKVNICLYGQPGIGKSVLAAKAPGALVVQCERNAALPLLLHEATQDVPVLSIKESKDVKELYWEIKKAGWDNTQTVVLDTASELQARNLNEIWRAEAAKGKRPEGHAHQQDYLTNTEFMRDIIISYCDLECNVIFVCHETEEKNDTDGSVMTRPMFTPKLSATMYGYVDLMAYMYADINIKGEMTRKMRAAPTRSIKAKDRLGLPSLFDAEQLWELASVN
jgi:phage nucleotide-binding protein